LRCWRAWPRLGAPDPEAVVDAAVDGLGVEAARVEALEVGVAGRDGADVFGAVETACLVLASAMQPHGDLLAVVVVGELVVAVPAVPAALLSRLR
jgi:hypothetical protein